MQVFGRVGNVFLLPTKMAAKRWAAKIRYPPYPKFIIPENLWFRTYNEVLFVEMESQNGFYEPLIGYIVLEQAQIIVDMIGHRLIHLNKIDLK